MTNTTTRTRTRKSTTAARSTTRKATKATAASEQKTYTIHSLDEYQIDTRVTRISPLNADEARELTIEIQRTEARLWLLVTEAHDRKAHLALGYETWADYVRAELNMSESRSYQFLDTGHVMKALASAGVDIEAYAPPPTRVVARVKDRLTDVRKAAEKAVKQEGDQDPMKAVDKAVRALAREPRKGAVTGRNGGNGGGASAASRGGNGGGRAAGAGEASDQDLVTCPACAGTGKVTKTVADKLLDLLKRNR